MQTFYSDTYPTSSNITIEGKPRTWVCARYFGKFNKFRNDHWVFGDAASGAYLIKFSWTDIVRHIPVTGGHLPTTPP